MVEWLCELRGAGRSWHSKIGGTRTSPRVECLGVWGERPTAEGGNRPIIVGSLLPHKVNRWSDSILGLIGLVLCPQGSGGNMLLVVPVCRQ